MALQVNALTKRFGAKTAVDALSFSLPSPGVFGLIGTNGAGKTTTIRMILGVMTPDGGSALWNGASITRESVRFGYLPEERGIYPKITVGEQLVYFGMLRGMTRADAAAAVKKWLARLEISEYENVISDKLSKGNQQKVQLIAALVHDPELIFLDEPFSGLDPINTDVFKNVIGELVGAGKYIIMSSHQMSTVEEYCENLVILNKGKTMLSGNLREIKRSYGHTDLTLSAGDGADDIAARLGLVTVEKTPEETHYKITGDAMARDFLAALVGAGIFVTHFEIREPSLHEIFISAVNGGEESDK